MVFKYELQLIDAALLWILIIIFLWHQGNPILVQFSYRDILHLHGDRGRKRVACSSEESKLKLKMEGKLISMGISSSTEKYFKVFVH